MINSALALVMLVGSYGTEADTTFHTYTFDSNDGKAINIQSLTGIANPSFITVADDATVIAVNENPTATAGVTMLKRDQNNPTKFNVVASRLTGGAGPCHVAVSPDGKYVVTANYSDGSITIVPFDSEKSSFGEPTVMKFEGHGPVNGRQDSSHAHFISFTPDARAMIVDDLGTDRLHIFPLGPDGLPMLQEMKDVEIAAGSGPRHLVFDHKGKNAYLINEISGTVTHLRYDPAETTLTVVSDTPADLFNAAGSADIHLSPDGRFLYVSNRLKGDGIMIFTVDKNDGSLTQAGFTSTGRHPRNFAITPDGRWLLVACRDDNVIQVFSRNPADGSLTLTDNTIPCPLPVCITFH